MLERLRYHLFWSVDFLKGSPVRKHCKDIQSILENYDSDSSIDKKKQYLNKLLDHAVKFVEFYNKYKGFNRLEDFPVVNQGILKNNFETIQASNYRGRKHFKMSTSGSTGTPFTILQNADKKVRNTADTIYFKKQIGYEVGHRMYYIRRWFKKLKSTPWSNKIKNVVEVDVTDFSQEYLKKFIEDLENDKSKKVILAYSSALREICKYLDNAESEGVETNLECIISMAEGLSTQTRKSLKKYFKAPVYSRYSNNENGILSLQLSEIDPYFQINWASYHIEILHPERDEPVAFGQIGRVVITDLFNYHMPFIRYDTGDMAVMEENDTFNSAPAFKEIIGRKMDVIYDTSGNPKSSFIIFHLDAYPQIDQFQIIQQAKKQYVIKLNVKNKRKVNELEIIKLYKSYLGDDAEIDFEYEDVIPTLTSGKRRLTINNYIKDLTA
ncbi:phenylacetate--CoA ligase family protein [Cytophaga sp. FL35]|uniref:phenylacetate--CoA ligase family protein n=1 Tax=Cytophaga sp. FL35 TaxID=1904456 RepID=UPI00165389A2|nr:phenylacetate--CoA ligase family protein [Cytophaga sp. FL35]MBC7000089.1 phenylacetate--CoA ligase family protein [Cytophaga sp. FL35]